MSFDNVFEILIQHGLNPGPISRVGICNKGLYNHVTNHQYYWHYVAQEKFGWKKPCKVNIKVINAFSEQRKCRECGISLCYQTNCSNGNKTWLCIKCVNEVNGYSELYSRAQIFNRIDVWSHKRRIVNNLTVAKKGRASKYLYWRYEVKKYRIQAILKNKRILPF